MKRRISAALAVLVTGALLVSASVASASVAPTQYVTGQAGMDCINFQDAQHVAPSNIPPLLDSLYNSAFPTVSIGSYASVHRPYWAWDYAGTTNLYWAPYLKFTNTQTGRTAAGQVTDQNARPWRAVWQRTPGNWLTNLDWNGPSAPSYIVKFFVPPHVVLQIWGSTYWQSATGAVLIHSYHYYGSCTG